MSKEVSIYTMSSIYLANYNERKGRLVNFHFCNVSKLSLSPSKMRQVRELRAIIVLTAIQMRTRGTF